MREKYSGGFDARIYLLTPNQKILFPQADLVREYETNDKNWFARLFYRHRVASLLFPDNFIDVVAAQVEPWQENLINEEQTEMIVSREAKNRTHKLFSKLAVVNKDHAIFSQHMYGRYDIVDRTKISLCSCGHCASHRVLHDETLMAIKARDAGEEMGMIGIFPPCDDPSDYCLKENGDIIFFEVERFDSIRIRSHLQKLPNPKPNEKRALKLLDRLDQLLNNSRDLGSNLRLD